MRVSTCGLSTRRQLFAKRCHRLCKSNAGEDSRAASGRRRGRGRQRQARGGERGGLAWSPPSCTHGGVLEGRAAVLVGQQGLGRPLAGVRGRSLGEDTSPELGPVARSRPRPLGTTGREGSLDYKASQKQSMLLGRPVRGGTAVGTREPGPRSPRRQTVTSRLTVWNWSRGWGIRASAPPEAVPALACAPGSVRARSTGLRVSSL